MIEDYMREIRDKHDVTVRLYLNRQDVFEAALGSGITDYTAEDKDAWLALDAAVKELETETAAANYDAESLERQYRKESGV